VAHLDSQINCIRISYVKTGEVVPNAEILYSLNEKKWCGETYGRKISCYCQYSGRGDNGELITGRSDIGVLMRNYSGFNFDDNAIPVKLITGSYVVGETNDVQFEELYIDALPSGEYYIPVTYYLDTRLTTNGSDQMILQGETVGSLPIYIADQTEFMNRGLFLIDKSKGRTIRFEIDWNAINRPFEIYGIYANYNTGAKIFSKFISGR
jgi:hypothetical protein